MVKHWEESGQSQIQDKTDLDSMLNKIHHRINMIKPDSKIPSHEAGSIQMNPSYYKTDHKIHFKDSCNLISALTSDFYLLFII